MPPAIPEGGIPVEGKGDQLARLMANSLPLQKLAQKNVETPLRSFHRGELVAVNLAQNTKIFYHDGSDPEAPWSLTSPSPSNTVVRDAHLEAVGAWIQSLDPQVVEYLKLASIKRGLLIEHLSRIGNPQARGIALAEYGAFHNVLKNRQGGFDTTDADQLKLALGPNREDITPHAIRYFKNTSHVADAVAAGRDGERAAPPCLIVNLSLSTFYYLSVHGDRTNDIAIDRVVSEADKAPEDYAGKIRGLLSSFISSDSEIHKRLLKIAAAQGAIIVALPAEAELRNQALELFGKALELSSVNCSRVRGVYFHVQESEPK
jgi:hypothetical protein